jgi:CheY-like chemotaxis protein
MTKRLLYAEDDDIVRGALSQLLTLLGWQVTTEPDGSAALNRLKAEEFDVVLTDHHMPETDGIGLVKNLRERGFPGRIYVISGALGVEQEREFPSSRVCSAPPDNAAAYAFGLSSM